MPTLDRQGTFRHYEVTALAPPWVDTLETIVFHHGVGITSETWLEWLPPLADRYRLASRSQGQVAAVRRGRRARRAQASPDRPHRGQPVLPRGERPRPGRAERARGVQNVSLDPVGELFGFAVSLAAFSRTFLAWTKAELGEFADGLAIGEEGVQLAEKSSSPASSLLSSWHMGSAYYRKGDLDKAMRHLERSLRLCEATDHLLFVPWVASCLASAYTLSGHGSETTRPLPSPPSWRCARSPPTVTSVSASSI